jgi:hypothetical protein
MFYCLTGVSGRLRQAYIELDVERQELSMKDKIETSPEWQSEAVVKRLQETTSPGQPSYVNVFLTDDVAASDLAEKAKEIVSNASESLNLPAGSVKIGKMYRLAKSFSISSDIPKVFDAIAKHSDVKTILETAQADILPQPRDVKDVT